MCKSGVKNAKKGENILDDIEDEEMYVDELEEESFENGPLDELESSQIYNLYFQFMKKHIILEKQNINELSIKGKEILNFIFCNKIENEDNKEINFELNNTKIKLNYNNDLLIPVDILNSATQIMICISGDNQDINGNYKIFNQIINQRHFENVDYYIYKWSSPEIYAQNENVMKENIAKIYGKLLAYIIASKQIFKFQTISFLVIGMGNIVLNSCLEELSTKINSIIDITDLIQDIILIDSNNELNLDIPQNFINMKLVAGKIINIYKKSEAKIEIPLNLNIRKSYSIIGINQNNDKIEDKDYFINCLPDIYNFDLINDLHISEKDYIFDINYILKKAKEKIYENY